MAVERVAADVVKGITRKNAPRYISTGTTAVHCFNNYA